MSKSTSKASSKGSAKDKTSSDSSAALLADHKDYVRLNSTHLANTATILDPQAYDGLDNKFSLELVEKNLEIDIVELSRDRIIFDMIGIEAPIANAIRRILLSEVPTIAIEKVIIYQNTSIIADEVLAHRLGLIPIKVDPSLFSYRNNANNPHYNPLTAGDDSLTDQNTVIFTLDVKCTRNDSVSDSGTNEEKYNNSVIYSRDLLWSPQGNQQEKFKNNPIQPYYNDIIIAKLRPGQSIEAELYCEKGIGATHAKWSPVATASYRLMPNIRIVQPILNEDAVKLYNKCPMKVFDIEEITGNNNKAGKRAVVARPRNCSMCRECTRSTEDWPAAEEKIELRRIKNHFIFSVETTGAYSPAQVVKEAINILKHKSNNLRKHIKLSNTNAAHENGQIDHNSF
jgi:DNA-directed RNA polymerase I and III subunit RPAC1